MCILTTMYGDNLSFCGNAPAPWGNTDRSWTTPWSGLMYTVVMFYSRVVNGYCIEVLDKTPWNA